MLQQEKDRLIELFSDEARWCQDVDAADLEGFAVNYDDEKAVRWDLVGGLCHLFGWDRASKMFGTVNRHLTGKRVLMMPNRNEVVLAMSMLVDFNDGEDMTHERLVEGLKTLPVWQGRRAI